MCRRRVLRRTVRGTIALMPRRARIDRIIDEVVARTTTGRVSVAIERIAEEMAREALADETFRRSLREAVSSSAKRYLEELHARERRRTKRRAAQA